MTFLIPGNISELTSSKKFFFHHWPPEGAANFFLKIGILLRKKLCRLKFWKKSLLPCHFFHFWTKKLIKSLSWLYKQKLRRLKFWWKSFLPCHFCLFWIKTNIKSLYCLERSDFFQNLSLDNFRLESQKSDFICFFITKWKNLIQGTIK